MLNFDDVGDESSSRTLSAIHGPTFQLYLIYIIFKFYVQHALIQFLGVEYMTSAQLVYEAKHAHIDSPEWFVDLSTQLGKTVQEICTVSRVVFNNRYLRTGFYSRFGFEHREKFAMGYVNCTLKNNVAILKSKCTPNSKLSKLLTSNPGINVNLISIKV